MVNTSNNSGPARVPDASHWPGDLFAALMFLTRLPVGQWATGRPLGHVAYTFPVAGLVAIIPAIITLWLAIWLNSPAPVAALAAIATGVLTTGALHEDGLADMADGFGGGHTKERKLEIMRDSRIGTFGVMALIFAVALQAAALADLTPHLLTAAAGLAAAASLSRAAMVWLMYQMDPARTDGRSAEAGSVSHEQALVALALATLITFALIWSTIGLWAFIWSIAACALCALAIKRLAQRHIGGQTGDVLGACQVVSQTAILIVLSALA